MPDQRTSIKGAEYPAGRHFSFERRFAARLRDIYQLLVTSLEGIEDADIRVRYASLLLYRLMFLYFIQQFGLLDGDRNYLAHRLAVAQEHSSDGKTFYRECLRPLFSGICTLKSQNLPLTSLFIWQTTEREHPGLALQDRVFVRLLALFDEACQPTDSLPTYQNYQTMLELIGTLFEHEINSREAGAYYTPVDVADYIARNTLLPALFTRTFPDKTKKLSQGYLWQQFMREPGRYIFPAVCLGYEKKLPREIEEGLANATLRQPWQALAPSAYGLPGETWRDVVARRSHVSEIFASLNACQTDQLKRLITWNLDQLQLTRDTLHSCQQPVFLETFYQSLRVLTILDPTCGSGAFLCAALRLLETLYRACLTRMQEWLTSRSADAPEPFVRRLFQAHLEEAGNSAQWQWTIPKRILEHNLYGVDLMEEAVEICRLRLFLRLLTEEDGATNRFPASFGEHIRVGNSLVSPLFPPPEGSELSAGPARYTRQAFVWSQVFPEAMMRGGFDVVIGNPPYVQYERVRQSYEIHGYSTLQTGNLSALTIERSLHLLAPGGRFGMIVPASVTCTDGYRSLQQLLHKQQELHIASFSDQRGRLFALSHARLCIILAEKAPSSSSSPGQVFSTSYLKLERTQRASLFERIYYTEVTQQIRPGIIPRYGSPLERTIASRLAHQAHRLGFYLQANAPHHIYYTRKLSWFVQVTPFIPLILDELGQIRSPSELKLLCFASSLYARIAFTALNSNLFYWLLTTSSDCRNLNLREIRSLPLDLSLMRPALQQQLWNLSQKLENDLVANSVLKPMTFRGQGRLTIQCLYPARSKALLDEIDQVLAEHYGFTAEELDFLLHYDGKYRQPRQKKL